MRNEVPGITTCLHRRSTGRIRGLKSERELQRSRCCRDRKKGWKRRGITFHETHREEEKGDHEAVAGRLNVDTRAHLWESRGNIAGIRAEKEWRGEEAITAVDPSLRQAILKKAKRGGCQEGVQGK